MGKPGGFFKRLHASKAKQASRQRRGTKGASKEERARKKAEQQIYFAAKREAELLREISSSDDDVESVDSVEEGKRVAARGMHRLASVFGCRNATSQRQKKMRHQMGGSASLADEEEELGEESGEELEENEKEVSLQAAAEEEEDDEEEEEDWKALLGEEEEESEEEEYDLLADLEEDEELGEDAEENPLLMLEDNGDAADDEDRFTRSVPFTEAVEEDEEGEEEEEEEEESDREEEYMREADEEVGGAAPSNDKILLRSRNSNSTVLSSFEWNAYPSSTAALKAKQLVEPTDPWFRKYMLDDTPVTTSPATHFQPIAVPPEALEALESSHEVYKTQADALLAELQASRQQRTPSFVRREDYAGLKPENVRVEATEAALKGLLHTPFSIAPHELTQRPPYLHPELWDRWVLYRSKQHLPPFTLEERGLFDLCQGYADILESHRPWQQKASRREIYVLHLLNHWAKASAVVLAHDEMIASRREAANVKRKKKKANRKRRREAGQKEEDEEEEEDDDDEDELEYRDRGFSKTRLMVVLPMRHHAYLYMHTIVSILNVDPTQCPKLRTFEDDFSEIEEAMDPTFRKRPRDYQREFDGNIDDSFCVGVKLGVDSVAVYSHPLNSDLLICSPLGLRRRLEKNGDALVSLSSIEVCLVDDAQVLLQQNWTHAAVVLEELLNRRPNDTTRGLSDLRRTYPWALKDECASHRQTIIVSEICVAPILSTFKALTNDWGSVRLAHDVDSGILSHVKSAAPQLFHRFTPTSLQASDDERLDFFMDHIFVKKLYPLAQRDVRTIIYVPSYFDFVRLRTRLHQDYREVYAALSEYSSIKQQRKALGQFSDAECPILLVTERFYYFKRYFISKSEAVVFYSPPLIPSFYTAFVNRMSVGSPNLMVLTLFSRYDAHELIRIVGTERARQLLQRGASVFSFVLN